MFLVGHLVRFGSSHNSNKCSRVEVLGVIGFCCGNPKKSKIEGIPPKIWSFKCTLKRFTISTARASTIVRIKRKGSQEVEGFAAQHLEFDAKKICWCKQRLHIV